MKLGLSSYSLYQAIADGRLTIVDAVKWVAEHGGEHIEIVPAGYDLIETPELIGQIRDAAEQAGIELSGYLIGANFLQDGAEAQQQEIDRVKLHVDIASKLGVRNMRFDVAYAAIDEDRSLSRFESDLPVLTAGCRAVADYAAQFGIMTSVENHGYYIQASERVNRLVKVVDRENFRTTLDVGNFWCADEDPLLGVKRNVEIASFVHFKDFYRRLSSKQPGEGWFPSAGGYWLRGAICGYGDLDLAATVRVLKEAGYDGHLSIEFEGQEDCLLASRINLANVRRLWEEA
ncbi:sugar phosphate isomerase/epimerase family protein [Paenibacillus eucommiae]|uniref:Sugar phosphate isomerase/epimerase n=1 Tax=Paenibacillus eucommiae TaxID=1355755 RepID=A0ABS4J487_9BACL|nr:sugar phosphate isomerase/epimerase [Paenibacillus eucommiae]MBP1994051.1 sugar phosphate isomerase/epimerase [Paenibacillus eucommiae]